MQFTFMLTDDNGTLGGVVKVFSRIFWCFNGWGEINVPDLFNSQIVNADLQTFIIVKRFTKTASTA